MDWYEETIKTLQEELNTLPSGTKEYTDVLDALGKIQELKIKEEKFNNDTWEAVERVKSDKNRKLMDILKIAAQVGGSILSLVLVMVFEKTGHILPQRFVGWISKIKL